MYYPPSFSLCMLSNIPPYYKWHISVKYISLGGGSLWVPIIVHVIWVRDV